MASFEQPLPTCFLDHQVVKPLAGFLVVALVALVGWVGWGHMSFVEQQVTPMINQGRPFLGIQVVRPDELVARMFSFPPGEAVFVSHVLRQSPAARAGIKRGDGIVAIDGRSIGSAGDVAAILDRAKAGDLLRLTVVRGGLIHNVMLPLDQPAG